MNSASETSLYELALQSDFPPPALQLSPTSFKSISDSLINLLIEQKIAALVWAKLPKGETWHASLEQYARLEGVSKTIYLFAHPQEELKISTARSDAPTLAQLMSSDDISEMTNVAEKVSTTPIFSIQLAPENALRREYFLIIWSAQLPIALFARRPRSAQSPKIADSLASLDTMSSYGQVSQLLENTPDRKQMLLTRCSCDITLIEGALHRLEQILAGLMSDQLPPQSDELTALQTFTAELVAHWTKQRLALASTGLNVRLAEQLFGQTLQQQEDLWQQNRTYRKQAEGADSLRLQNEELIDTLRLKDEFLNTVGQELRTPLTTIKTALSLLGSPTIKLPQRQRYMELIEKECDRQSSLITSLLDLVHLDQVVDQSALPALRLSDVVPGVVTTYQPVAEEKGIRLAYTVPEDLLPVACMSNWLKQIVINLLHNAIKFTLTGGQVSVRAKQQGDYVQLEIRDTGVGIASSEIPKIFDRFYRVRQSADDSSGAGLGLTIVQQLLLHCGGSISVKSRVGEGSTFNVLLPVYKSSSDLGL
ncbi:histidine kinase [Phormidium sp. CLA17]|uniref:DICT sensory domain-containing protein n=1 Tax=Leptolyngbya sp. Cla-17 TaxID=2803751 RepID=UPI001491AA75|nr:DICT sensory domain-containing protein [Leptolyngbya sp. Cla-17]MBM0742418.1 histidine kinase [Leptolyngbya sp. Cla-17]